MLANSNFVRSRIRRIYGRDSRVVFPPVELHESEAVREKGDYYITASFLAPYKRTDLVIKAFNEMPHRKLRVVGEGQDAKSLRALAGPNVQFTGFLPRNEYVSQVAHAQALVFAGCEDFGIALAEAQAWGTPLVAFGRGGARDIVCPISGPAPPTGVLFEKQTVASVREAVETFETQRDRITPEACRDNAARFAPERFRREIRDMFAEAATLNANS